MTADAPTAHTSYLTHARYRWARVAALLCLVSLALYLWHDPADGPNGGTWLGYTLGTLGALLIFWLTWLGVRKRRYASNMGSVKGWVSAHVYLGLSLLVIATLHSGFQVGWNIHTLAYVLMLVVIASGLYGITVYARLPAAITQLRQGGTREAWLEEVLDLNEQAVRLADQLGPDVHKRILASAERMKIGGGLRDQLLGPRQRGVGDDMTLLSQRIRDAQKPVPEKATSFDQTSTVSFMAAEMVQGDRAEKNVQLARQLMDILARRNALAGRINRDIALHARMQVWLLLHVPLSLALLAALLAHIVSVFLYW